LVQINDNAANSGNITYNRKLILLFQSKNDYVYWSTPVSENSNSTSVALKPILGEIQTGTYIIRLTMVHGQENLKIHKWKQE
jgi:hypothetical protein